MSLITILSTVRNATHAVYASSMTGSGVQLLVDNGLLVKGQRSCSGKVFTKESDRSLVDELIKGYSNGHILSILGVIKANLTSISKNEIAVKLFNTTYGTSIGSKVDLLVSADLIKQHRRKAGYYFTNPDKAGFIISLLNEVSAVPQPATGYNLTANQKELLKRVKTAPHAVNPLSVLGGNIAEITRDAKTLIELGLLKKGTRSCSGKVFTNPARAEEINRILSSYAENRTATPVPAPQAEAPGSTAVTTTSHGYTLSNTDKAVLKAIKDAPASVTYGDIYNALDRNLQVPTNVLVSIGFLIGLGLVRLHSKKPDYYFTEPTKADVIAAMFPASTPATPVAEEGEVVPADAVLALCRLSEHGISMNGVWAAFQKLISEGIIRADKRDANKTSKNVRYFTRKGGPRMGDIRGKAEARIAKLIAKNENLVDLVNEAVDQAPAIR